MESTQRPSCASTARSARHNYNFLDFKPNNKQQELAEKTSRKVLLTFEARTLFADRYWGRDDSFTSTANIHSPTRALTAVTAPMKIPHASRANLLCCPMTEALRDSVRSNWPIGTGAVRLKHALRKKEDLNRGTLTLAYRGDSSGNVPENPRPQPQYFDLCLGVDRLQSC